MQDKFTLDLPPSAILVQLLSHSSKCALTYIELWRQKDKNSKIIVNSDQIRNRFLISMTKFKNDLMILVREGLINVNDNGYKFEIEVVNFDDD